MKKAHIYAIPAIGAALIAVLAQISMPIGPVPFTLQNFAIGLIATVFRPREAVLSVGLYLLLGAIGLPVFAGFSGGIQNLVGPTGGFLISFPIMAWLIGVGVEKRKQTGMFILFLILGTVANYVIGVVMFCAIMHASVTTAVAACVIPFIPTAIIKAVVAAILGLKIRDRLAVSMQWA